MLMMRPPVLRVVYVAFGILAVPAPAAFAQQTAPKDDSVFALVDECDVLAAYPEDPERYADGVEDDLIVPRLARLACERAVQRSPKEPRFAFQLGRALLAAGRDAEAAAQFRRAADSGYGAGLAFLGNAYQFGWGVPADAAAARDLYRKAAAAGFDAARDFEDSVTFDTSVFVARTFLGSLYRGDQEALTRESADPKVRNHAFNFVLTLMDECGPVIPPETIPGLYLYRFPPDLDLDIDESLPVTIQTSVGEYDAARFVLRYGCDGPVADQMYRRIQAFFTRR